MIFASDQNVINEPENYGLPAGYPLSAGVGGQMRISHAAPEDCFLFALFFMLYSLIRANKGIDEGGGFMRSMQ